jgi:hypothetical protein
MKEAGVEYLLLDALISALRRGRYGNPKEIDARAMADYRVELARGPRG